MGRGLAAILSVSDEARGEPRSCASSPLELIPPNPDQPRKRFDDEGLAGSRRLALRARRPAAGAGAAARRRALRADRRGAPLAGGEARRPRRDPGDRARARRRRRARAGAVENMAREDLNPVEQARACAALVEELGLTREDVGRRVGRSRVAVSNLLRLLDLPDEALDLLERGG